MTTSPRVNAIVEQLARDIQLDPNHIGRGLVVFDIYHDGWCYALKGGECICDPIVQINKDYRPNVGRS